MCMSTLARFFRTLPQSPTRRVSPTAANKTTAFIRPIRVAGNASRQSVARRVTAASCTPDADDALTSGMDAASNRHAPALLLCWGAAAGSTAYLALQSYNVSPDLLLLTGTTFWLAVVASLALTEAWVKFRAPLLDRHVGVDVGRRVFRAQYALEAALALACAAMLCAKGGNSLAGVLGLLSGPSQGALRLLAAAAALLLVEVVWLFPALDLRGKRLIASCAMADAAALSPERLAYVRGLQREVRGQAEPPAQLHLLSIVVALGKAGLLAASMWLQLLTLAA